MILVCAATGTEAAACRSGIADSGAVGFEVLTTGVGPARAAVALELRLGRVDGASAAPAGSPASRISAQRPALIVSSGFAGTVSPGIEPLEWVTASSVQRLVDGRAVPVALPPGLLCVAKGVTACHVITADHVLSGAACGVGHPAAVDMESAALAEVAAAAGIPFLVLRLVTDTPARPLAALGRKIAIALAAPGVASRAAHGTRAALEAARSPGAALAFVRESLGWRARLRQGWRGFARRGVPSRTRE